MEKQTEKVYKLWGGNNRFLFNGVIMVGPDIYRVIYPVLFLICPEIVFITTVFTSLPISITVISTSLLITDLFLLLLVAKSNPGYIPKQEFPFAIGPHRSPTLYSALVNEPAKPAALERPYFEYSSSSSRIRLKYCRTCYILRPPRTSHCPDCNLCVERFDHHCPWIGNCVGKKNYNLFFCFILWTAGLIAFHLAVCLKVILNYKELKTREFLEEAGSAVFLMVYCFFMLVLVGGLTLFHIYLFLVNLTTNEALKKTNNFPKMNPFKRQSVFRQFLIACRQKNWIFYKLTKKVRVANKDLCSDCFSKEALKQNTITDFEMTVQIESPLKNNSALVCPGS